jgi:hypothetical protein
MLSALDRHLKQAVVAKSPAVASAAIVAGLHLSNLNADMVTL